MYGVLAPIACECLHPSIDRQHRPADTTTIHGPAQTPPSSLDPSSSSQRSTGSVKRVRLLALSFIQLRLSTCSYPPTCLVTDDLLSINRASTARTMVRPTSLTRHLRLSAVHGPSSSAKRPRLCPHQTSSHRHSTRDGDQREQGCIAKSLDERSDW